MSDKIQRLLKQARLLESEEKSSVAFAERSFSDAFAADDYFDKIKEELFRIENWQNNSGVCNFELFDENGNKAHEKTLAVNDFICVELPASGKNDWVKIINIHRAEGEIVVTVQPSHDPTEDVPDKSVTSHFFTDESTNNFCLQKKAEIVSFYVIGLNEKSNTEDTQNIIETVRNFATANLGYYLGVQKREWETFCKNFLEIEESKK